MYHREKKSHWIIIQVQVFQFFLTFWDQNWWFYSNPESTVWMVCVSEAKIQISLLIVRRGAKDFDQLDPKPPDWIVGQEYSSGRYISRRGWDLLWSKNVRSLTRGPNWPFICLDFMEGAEEISIIELKQGRGWIGCTIKGDVLGRSPFI